jgi:hypothetical protein
MRWLWGQRFWFRKWLFPLTKRTILAAWASDFYAVRFEPAIRQLPGTPEAVSIDEVQSALKELDRRYGI